MKRKICRFFGREISGFAEVNFNPTLRAAAISFPDFVPVQSGSPPPSLSAPRQEEK